VKLILYIFIFSSISVNGQVDLSRLIGRQVDDALVKEIFSSNIVKACHLSTKITEWEKPVHHVTTQKMYCVSSPNMKEEDFWNSEYDTASEPFTPYVEFWTRSSSLKSEYDTIFSLIVSLKSGSNLVDTLVKDAPAKPFLENLFCRNEDSSKNHLTWRPLRAFMNEKTHDIVNISYVYGEEKHNSMILYGYEDGVLTDVLFKSTALDEPEYEGESFKVSSMKFDFSSLGPEYMLLDKKGAGAGYAHSGRNASNYEGAWDNYQKLTRLGFYRFKSVTSLEFPHATKSNFYVLKDGAVEIKTFCWQSKTKSREAFEVEDIRTVLINLKSFSSLENLILPEGIQLPNSLDECQTRSDRIYERVSMCGTYVIFACEKVAFLFEKGQLRKLLLYRYPDGYEWREFHVK